MTLAKEMDCPTEHSPTDAHDDGISADTTASGVADTIGDTYVTLAPYETNNRRKNTKKLRRQNQQQNNILNQIATQPDYMKFYTISSVSGRNLSEINIIKANEELEACLGGSPKKVSELRNGALLVEVSSAVQGDALQSLTSLDDCPITVSLHGSLNQCRGTMYYQNKSKYSDEQLLDHLKQYNVTEIYQLKSNRTGSLQALPIYTLTFKGCKLPDFVRIGWLECPIRLYIPKPRRCFKCQKFGHGARTCRSEVDVCIRCADTSTHSQPCNQPIKCVNCNKAHLASSRECFYYLLEADTLALQAKENIRYMEAKRIVKRRHQKSGTTYASAAATGTTPVAPAIQPTTFAPAATSTISDNHAENNVSAAHTTTSLAPTVKPAPKALISSSDRETPRGTETRSSARTGTSSIETSQINSQIPTSAPSTSKPNKKRMAETSPDKPLSKYKHISKTHPMPKNVPTYLPPSESSILHTGRNTSSKISDNYNLSYRKKSHN